MSKSPWLTSELGVLGALQQSVELCRAGFRRPVLTLALSLGIAGAVVGSMIFGRHEYAPKFVLRVVEGARTTGDAPPLRRQLAEYVRQAVLTSEPLYAVMRRHGLYQSLMRKNARAALEAFKEDISVDVYQNYFVAERARGNVPRSARLTVSFRAKDPQLALDVTRDLGGFIVRHELAARRDQALLSATRATQARDILVGAWQQRSAELASKQRQLSKSGAPDPRVQVEVVGLLGSLGALEHQVEAAERRASTLELGAGLERGGIGLFFEVVDDGALPERSGQLQAQLLAGATTLLLGVPLIALAVGAFSSTRRGLA
jgi:hypothetical protein